MDFSFNTEVSRSSNGRIRSRKRFLCQWLQQSSSFKVNFKFETRTDFSYLESFLTGPFLLSHFVLNPPKKNIFFGVNWWKKCDTIHRQQKKSSRFSPELENSRERTSNERLGNEKKKKKQRTSKEKIQKKRRREKKRSTMTSALPGQRTTSSTGFLF